MENLKNIKLKKLFIFVLPIIMVIMSLAVFFLSQGSDKKGLTLQTQETYLAQTESLPALNMKGPVSKHYYNELYKKQLAGDESKELACAFYNKFATNIDKLMSGQSFNLFDGITTTVGKFFNESDVVNQEFQNAIDAFSMDYAAISNAFSWSLPTTYTQSTFTLSTTTPTGYDITFEELRNGINQMTEIAESLNFASGATDYDKVLVVHDFIINNTTYQLGAELNQTAYSALINGRTVCSGYAKSFKYIMDVLEINTILVSGIGGAIANPENHIWNYVQLDSKWYCIDLTWDDSSDQLNYDYFLIDFPTFTNDGTNLHTLNTRFQYTGGAESEMEYTFPTPSSNDYAYPENPESTQTYTTHVDTDVDKMELGDDYTVETISPVERGNYVTVKFTLLNTEAFYLEETNSITSNGSKPILVSKIVNSSLQPVWTYKIIITNANCNVVFNFDTYLHDITLTPLSAADGTATLNKTQAQKGETITITINLLDSTTRSVRDIIIKDEANKTISYYTKVTNQEYTFEMPSTDTTVEILIATIYSISQGTINNGSATLHFNKLTAMEGETITVEVKDITAGMRATSLSSTNVETFTSLGKKTNKFTFVMPASNVVIDATLTPIPPTVTTKDFKINMANGNATISYSVESLEVGEEVTITINPSFGKKLKSISCQGVEFTAVKDGQEYSFTVPSEDFEIKLEFEDKYGFDAMIAVYAVCGVVGVVFIIFLFTAFPKREKKDY